MKTYHLLLVCFFLILIPSSREDVFCRFFYGFGKGASTDPKSKCPGDMLNACTVTQNLINAINDLFHGKTSSAKVLVLLVNLINYYNRVTETCPDIVDNINILDEWPVMVVSLVVYYNQIIANFQNVVKYWKAEQYYNSGLNFGNVFFLMM